MSGKSFFLLLALSGANVPSRSRHGWTRAIVGYGVGGDRAAVTTGRPTRAAVGGSSQGHQRDILWKVRTGAPWRDMPVRYGPWQTCYDRFARWHRQGGVHRNHISCALLVWSCTKSLAYRTGRTIYQIERDLLHDYLAQQLENPFVRMVLVQVLDSVPHAVTYRLQLHEHMKERLGFPETHDTAARSGRHQRQTPAKRGGRS